MNRGIRYDQMTKNPQNDRLGFFESYSKNMEIAQERIRQLQPNKVYDLGCGTCSISGLLSKEMYVVGIDKSEEMLGQARAKYPHMKLVCKDIESWTAESVIGENELIVSSFVLHAIPNKEYLFKWFRSVIESNNTVLIMDYLFDSDSAQLKYIKELRDNENGELADIIENKYYLKIDELEKWASQYNYSININLLTHWIGVIELKLF